MASPHGCSATPSAWPPSAAPSGRPSPPDPAESGDLGKARPALYLLLPTRRKALYLLLPTRRKALYLLLPTRRSGGQDDGRAVAEEALIGGDADAGALDLAANGLAAELPGELADL